jgi:hypothetical protein
LKCFQPESGHTAVGAQDLAIDPACIRAGEKRHYRGDVVRLTEALQRRHLREGLDLPEVSLVAILDADKEGFLRSETSLNASASRI